MHIFRDLTSKKHRIDITLVVNSCSTADKISVDFASINFGLQLSVFLVTYLDSRLPSLSFAKNTRKTILQLPQCLI